ncbi:MAG: hypothetical protein HIU88_13785 [Acidobacteria bacterium]|nr:hypothetical protein [Acidobacteriota bacterium]
MAGAPLSAAQQAAVRELVAAGRLEVVPVDEARAGAFLLQASEALADLPNVTRSQNRYNLAYDACHDVGEALLAAHGFRTTNGAGQHEALGQYLKAVLDAPPGNVAARRFDQLRRARNQQRYEAHPVGAADAELAATTSRGLYDAVVASGVHPSS